MLILAMTQRVKKNRDPRWEEEFQFTLEEPPTDDKVHVEVISTTSRMGLLHPKVHILHPLMQTQMTFCLNCNLHMLFDLVPSYIFFFPQAYTNYSEF